ncbi:MAG: hypothetical protein J1E03_12120 [Acetatifactor sp.]|nr:hypothetical protein [Acetatifactor sp.]
MKQKSINYRYIGAWLAEKNLKLEKSFAENLYFLAYEHKKTSPESKHNL